jgi:hypothetical protein
MEHVVSVRDCGEVPVVLYQAFKAIERPIENTG